MINIKRFAYAVTTIAIAVTSVVLYAQPVYAAACVSPETDYGMVTISATVSTSGTYRIWTRMAIPNETDNSYLLEVDGNTCYIVGGSSVPTYVEGSSTRFQAGTSNWRSRTTSNTQIDVSLSGGAHTLKLIGTAAGVAVDRVIITADINCVPKGNGDNCASTYIAADINTDTKVDFRDFSLLASKYTQSGDGLGRTDINSDGIINELDLSILANRWGQ